jgi:trehalose synthase
MHEVRVDPRPLAALAAVLPADQSSTFEEAAVRARESLAGGTLWNVSATATGGGVAEMMPNLLGYLIAAGVRARWLVLDGDEPFFAITKCVHNAIHGMGDRSALGPAEHAHYQQVLSRNLPQMLPQVRRNDLVLLHDPQSAGLVPALKSAGACVAWRSHIGRDTPNEQSVAGWEFLRPYIGQADAFVFSRLQYAPAWIPADRLWIIPPSIDPLAPKNVLISREDCQRVLVSAGLLAGNGSAPSGAVLGAPAPRADSRLVVQVSRWDRLKDMPGVMAGFTNAGLPDDTHLMLVGPSTAGVTDDPEGADVLAESLARWRALPDTTRGRVSLVSVPMDDLAQNATIVNALQRLATIVVQKSLAEGFGLTVTEALWKGKPMVASAVGGIQDQITSGQHGLLIEDPADLDAFGRSLRRLVTDADLARQLGQAARWRVLENYLEDTQLARTAQMIEAVLAGQRSGLGPAVDS